MVAKSTATRKAKGRNAQKELIELFHQVLDIYGVTLETGDVIESTSMGASGVDIKFFGNLKQMFPLAPEVKWQELGYAKVYDAYKQAQAHAAKDPGTIAVAFIKQNKHRPIAVVDASVFISMVYEIFSLGGH